MKDLIISILVVLILAGCVSAPDNAGTPLGDSWKSFYSTYDVEKLDKPTKAAYVPSETLQMYPSPSVEESKRYDSFKYWEQAFQVWFEKNKSLFESLSEGKECFFFVNFRALGSNIEIDDIRRVVFSSSSADFSWSHGNIGKFATVSKGIVVDGKLELRVSLRKFGDGFESKGEYKKDIYSDKPTLAVFRKLSAAEFSEGQYAGMAVIPMNLPK